MNPLATLLVVLGAGNALLAVALGAFGAHALQRIASTEMLEIWATGNEYHIIHALALLLLAALTTVLASPCLVKWSAGLLLTGMAIFSGSLYLLVLLDLRWLGAITPIGGILLLAGWLLLAVGAWRQYRRDNGAA